MVRVSDLGSCAVSAIVVGGQEALAYRQHRLPTGLRDLRLQDLAAMAGSASSEQEDARSLHCRSKAELDPANPEQAAVLGY